MSSIHPRVLERPLSEAVPAGSRRRALALAVIISVVLGGVAGWFMHRPGETTRTVAPPAYGAAAKVAGTVFFDGIHASYAGPAEVKTGTVVTLRLVSTRAGASLVVSRLSPAPTWSALSHDIATANASPAVMPMQYAHPLATVTGANAQAVRLARAGLYSIWVGPVKQPSTASVALATVVRVIG